MSRITHQVVTLVSSQKEIDLGPPHWFYIRTVDSADTNLNYNSLSTDVTAAALRWYTVEYI